MSGKRGAISIIMRTIEMVFKFKFYQKDQQLDKDTLNFTPYFLF